MGPERRDGLRRPDDPSDPQTGEGVRLAQAVDDQRSFMLAPYALRPRPLALRTDVHFIGEQPGTPVAGRVQHRLPLRLAHDRAGRVVRIADWDGLRLRRHVRAQLVRIELPAPALLQAE